MNHLTWFLVFAAAAFFILFSINKLTDAMCDQKEIPIERQGSVFRFINILITILLISSYVEVLYT